MPYWISSHPIMFLSIPDTLLISYVILQYPVIWNPFEIWQQIWHIYPLVRPVLYENKGVGYFRGKKKGCFMAKKDTLTIFHFGMNAAVWVKQ